MRKIESRELGDSSRLSLMMAVAFIILAAWHYFYEVPTIQKNMKSKLSVQQHQAETAIDTNTKQIPIDSVPTVISSLNKHKYISIKTDKIMGSWIINSATLSDIILHDYKSDVDHEEHISVLSSAPNNRYYFSLGWISKDIESIPGPTTEWTYNISHSNKSCPDNTLCLGSTLHMKWSNNKQDFAINLTVIDDYMLQTEQSVTNRDNAPVNISSYLRLKRNNIDVDDSDSVSHRGLVALVDDKFKEFSYKDLKKNTLLSYPKEHGGWLGVSDKYWLTAILPTTKKIENAESYDVNMRYLGDGSKKHDMQTEIIYEARSLSQKHPSSQTVSRIFVGPKDVNVLDEYAKKYDIKLFDRAIDFGIMYFITKPILLFLKFIYGFVGNYGLSIALMTIAVRAMLWPLSKKSYISMAKIKALQPQMAALRERHLNDKVSMNRAIMELYRSAKVNPLSGIMPLLIQLPIFFALYKVLYVSIEMRHSPFIFWIRDLSAPDPTSIFNLFGLLPFAVPKFLNIGVLPILMGLTMWIQQKSTASNVQNPAQARVLLWMPVIFTFLFANFASGLMIYWIVTNIFSIAQQYILARNK